MIKVESISRLFGNFHAVDDVSFNIGKGEIVGLLGHNGAGKTTIMKMLTGYLEPDAGKIVINGHELSATPETVKALIGYLPENLPLYQEMSIIDYLDYVAKLRGLNGQARVEAIQYALAQTELQDKALQLIATLSRGYKQRVGVAQAILHKPSVLILDEPTNGLDPTQTQHMRNLIKQCAEDATIILSTHIMQEVDAICNRVLILNNGKLALDERLESLQASQVITLETDASEEELKQILSGMDDKITIESRQYDPEFYLYYLHLPEQANFKQVVASVTSRIVNENRSVYLIEQRKHDLESVFRRVSSAEETSDAA